jgi:lipopolysaccharide biosynthesis glycosyltransferase
MKASSYQKKTINIIFSSDNNYAPYMGVAICSIFENKKEGYKIDIYVLDGGIQEDNKNKLKILENKYNFKINYIAMNNSFFKDFYISGYLSQATYYRILIPDLLPKLDKALYLDCDMIINGNIAELYNINIEKYFFAAVKDEGYSSNFFVTQEKTKNEIYFNAGMMLLNLAKWRETNINKVIINFIKEKNSKLNNHDQDAINSILHGQWLIIPYKYNYTSAIATLHPIKYKEIDEKILIIHYTGLKPWDYLSISKLNKKYLFYLKNTPWRDKKKINISFKNMLVRYIKITIYFLFSKNIIDKLRKIKRLLKIKF